ncbi:transporter substrate-binding domain-containing protein [Streptomyces sp. NPDC101191]|uniref:transporter substrate-binding domain-containing protein n=1 Tax=Streptomyces sp. NPDC101191 TaxID=3366126 RepID=UPI0038166CCB
MPRKRQFVQRPNAKELAEFVVRITRPRSIKDVHELMGSPSRATWAKYMNGSAIIPRRTLGALVKAVSGTDSHRLSALLREASLLWKAADDESRRPEEDGGESALVRLHERLAEAMEGRHRADLAAAKANATVGTLRDMGALMGVVIDSTKAQLRMATDRERLGLKQQLGEAERRSERIAQELARARSRRYTAEQARQALAKEMIAAREEIARLQHSIARISVPDLPAMAPVALLPAPAVVMEVLDERLAVIVSEGHEADEEVADLAELANLEPGAFVKPRSIVGEVVDPRDPEPAPPPDNHRKKAAQPLDATASGPGRPVHDKPPGSLRPHGSGLVAACLVLAAVLGGSLAADTPRPKDSVHDPLSGSNADPLTIGVAIDAPGLSDTSTGRFQGFEASMGMSLARNLGSGSASPRFMALTFEKRMSALRTGEVDMVIAHVEITDLRREEVDFVGPYLRSYHGVLTRKGDKGISSFKDLAGRRVCTRRGSTAQIVQLNVHDTPIETLPGLGECVVALRRHEVDAVVDAQVDLYGYTERYDDIEVPPAVTDGRPAGFFAVALPKGTPVASCKRVYRALQEYVRTRWSRDFESNLKKAVKAFPTTWNAFAPSEGDMNRHSSCTAP